MIFLIFLLQIKSQKCKNTFAIVSDATKIIYEHYGVDKYLYAIGLSVDPAYRGYGLGKDILKIRYAYIYMLKNYAFPSSHIICIIYTNK